MKEMTKEKLGLKRQKVLERDPRKLSNKSLALRRRL